MNEPMPWRLALVCCALCFAAGGLYGWSAMAPALDEVFSASAEQSGLVFSTAIVAFSVSVFAAPRLPAVLRGLPGAAVMGFVGAASLLLAANAASFVMFILAYGAGFGVASGAIYILSMEIAGRYTNSRAMTALLVASFGFGGVVFGPLQRLLVAAGMELSALLALAGALALASLAGTWLWLAGKGVSTRAIPSTTPKFSNPSITKRPTGLTFGTILLLWAGFGLGSIAGLMVLGLATTIIEVRGGTIWGSSLAIFFVALGNSLGRLSAGTMEQVLPLRWLVVAAPMISILGLGGALVSTSPFWVGAGLTAIALGYGMVAASFPILTHKLAGSELFARTYSIVFSAWGVAGLLGPWLGGRAYDATGSFALPLTLALASSVGAFIVAMLLSRRLPASQQHQN